MPASESFHVAVCKSPGAVAHSPLPRVPPSPSRPKVSSCGAGANLVCGDPSLATGWHPLAKLAQGHLRVPNSSPLLHRSAGKYTESSAVHLVRSKECLGHHIPMRAAFRGACPPELSRGHLSRVRWYQGHGMPKVVYAYLAATCGPSAHSRCGTIVNL